MTVGQSLRRALADFYGQSWRLAILNTALCVFVAAIAIAVFYAPYALVLLLVIGPLAAALMHCAVTLAQEEELRLADAVVGLRLHWRRGLILGSVVLGAVVLGGLAIVFYAGSGALAWPLSILALYLLAVFGVVQLALWPLAIFDRERPLMAVSRDAVLAVMGRPAAFAGLALALLLLNLVSAAAALAPFFTVTIAYSFLAAAHFSLPRKSTREA